jgi:hypothetical protein
MILEDPSSTGNLDISLWVEWMQEWNTLWATHSELAVSQHHAQLVVILMMGSVWKSRSPGQICISLLGYVLSFVVTMLDSNKYLRVKKLSI